MTILANMANNKPDPGKGHLASDSKTPDAFAIVASLVNGSTGLTAPEIQATLTREFRLTVSGPTIRRWLNELAESGRIRAVGERRGRRYLPLPAESAQEVKKPETDKVDVPDDFPPLSPE